MSAPTRESQRLLPEASLDGHDRRRSSWLSRLHWLIEPIGLAVTAGVFLTAYLVGKYLAAKGGSTVYAAFAPIYGYFDKHHGPGTPWAIGLAIAAVLLAMPLARRLPWRLLLLGSWITAIGWTTALAMIDGLDTGILSRLRSQGEYLYELSQIHSVTGFLRIFSDHIVIGNDGFAWTTHVSSHPPGATLIFVLLRNVGLGGPRWAGAVVIALGSLVAVAVPLTIKLLASQEAARAVLPFVVFFPGAVWIGVSADGLFAGVAASGVALAVMGVLSKRRWAGVIAVVGGLLLGTTLYFSYGLALFGLVVAAAALCAIPAVMRADGSMARWWRRWALVALGVLAVVITFSALGFLWWQGAHQVHIRYYQGIGKLRPYSYWVWANLGAVAVCAGPAAGVAVARAVRALIPVVRGISNDGRGAATGEVALTAATARTAPGQPTSAGGSGSVPAEPSGNAVSTLRRRTIASRSAAVRQNWPDLAPRVVPAMLTLAALIAILIADVSGMSKAETERIWLPFNVWLIAALALIPRRSAPLVLAAQVGTALIINHLVMTQW